MDVVAREEEEPPLLVCWARTEVLKTRAVVTRIAAIVVILLMTRYVLSYS